MTAVKLIHSGMAGAPTLANVAGNLVSVLNAALVDGFALGTVDSLVIASGVATVTRAAGHPFDVGSVALIAGATTTTGTVNGERRVLAITATSYTFDAAGIGNQTATGTITHAVAPLGWGRPFAGSATLQVYRSADVTGTRLYCRVDDTGTTNARVVGYETMSTDSAGTGPFPTATQLSGGMFWPKSNAATARTWMIIGDGRLFYFYVIPAGSTSSMVQGFGDFVSKKSPDPYGCLLSGHTADQSSLSGNASSSLEYTNATVSGTYLARGVSGLGTSVQVARVALMPTGYAQGNFSGSPTTNHFSFPNPADNSIYLAPFVLSELTPTQSYRGDLPGAFYLPHSVGAGVFALRERITGVTGYAGRTFTAFPHATGVMFFDTTGPWR